MLIQWCSPEPDFKCIPMARALQQRGHTVEVLTGFPNYPGGKVYPGYHIRPWQRELIAGVPVTRVPLFPSHDHSALRRAANYASFALSSAVLGPWLTRKPDVIYAYNPMGLPALILKALKGAPFVYDIQDLWPDSIFSSGMMRPPPLVSRTLHGFFRYVYRHAAHLLVLSPGFKSILVQRGVSAGKISVVHNWTDEDAHRPQKPDAELAARLGMAGRFNIVYAGNIGRPQALDVVLNAAVQLARSDPRVLFTIIGRGTECERLRKAASAMCPGTVQFLPVVPPAEIGQYTALADVLLVNLRADPLFHATIPSKIQAYLAIGKPVLAGVMGDAADLLARSGAGVCFAPEDATELVAAVTRLARLPSADLAQMAESARTFYQRELSLAHAAQRYESIFLHSIQHRLKPVT